MSNPHGSFIWYELLTRDPDGAKAFYDDVVGWRLGAAPSSGDDYRMISAPDGFVGGVFRLSDDMTKQGARPVWLGYVGVDDVDVTLAKLQDLGGKVLMPAWEVPGVGRIAMVADPQGIPFYVMRGSVEDGVSTAFAPERDGHCAWNELATPDQSAALAFYGALFGWQSREAMPMGDLGEYRFLDHGDTRLGAMAPCAEREGTWLYYFRVPCIDAARSRIEARGGSLSLEPTEIPTGDYILIGTDPDGATFALVGPKGR